MAEGPKSSEIERRFSRRTLLKNTAAAIGGLAIGTVAGGALRAASSPQNVRLETSPAISPEQDRRYLQQQVAGFKEDIFEEINPNSNPE